MSSGAAKNQVRLGLISDTHGKHREITVGECDVLIHAGDCTNDIGQASLRDFLTWFEEQPATHKILIAGNHDGAFEKWPDLARLMVKERAPSVIYLEDSGCELYGLKFWGSPVTPTFFNWYFNRERGEEIKRHWDMIPKDTDVLITHGPPFSILDKAPRFSNFKSRIVSGYEQTGCRDLMEKVEEIKPSVHCFGHIHYSHGHHGIIHESGNVTDFFNASVVDEEYTTAHPPFYHDITTKEVRAIE